MKGEPTVTVIGVGNPYRRDDGVGLEIIRRIHRQVPEGVALVEHNGEGTALLEIWNKCANVMIVDAVQSGAPPGTIHRFDARAAPIPSRFFHCSTHALNTAEAIELARALNELPARLILYGIEVMDFAGGFGFSDEAERAATAATGQILEALANEVRMGCGP